MAKKERNPEVVFPSEPELRPEEEPVYEAEAYGAPQPEAGSDVTVMKTVGIGGPVPIVAPKHNTIQLQPIVVPLAVVPYMTQDSGVLRTDGRPAGGTLPQDEEATLFQTVAKEKEAKKRNPTRLFSLLLFLLSAVSILPFFLSYANVGKDLMSEFDFINVIKIWVEFKSFSFDPPANILNIVVVVMLAALVLSSLIGLIIGKFPRPISPILAFVALGCLVAELVIDVVGKAFIPKERIIFIVMLALTAVIFVMSVIFCCVLNKRDDSIEGETSLI